MATLTQICPFQINKREHMSHVCTHLMLSILMLLVRIMSSLFASGMSSSLLTTSAVCLAGSKSPWIACMLSDASINASLFDTSSSLRTTERRAARNVWYSVTYCSTCEKKGKKKVVGGEEGWE